MAAARIHRSPTVKRTARRLARSPLAMTKSTPPSASAMPARCQALTRSCSSWVEAKAMATGVAA